MIAMKQPYMTGLVISQLSPEELERYRALPVPKKYGYIPTLAPQDKSRTTILTTNVQNPYGKLVATR